jgi:methoxymalonate biosynthesis acyl carrier protein
MTEQDREPIRRFVADHVGGAEVDDEEDLFANGYVNSLFAVQLVMWLERTFDVVVARRDLDFTNFRSIAAIAAFVAGKRASGGDRTQVASGDSRGF